MNDKDIIQLAKHHFGAFFKSSDLEVRLAALVAVEKDKEIERLREALRDIAISENSMYQESRAKLALGEDQNIWRMCGVNTDDVIKMADEAGIVMSLTDERVTLNKLNRFLELHLKTLVSEGYRQCAKGQNTTQFCGLLEEAVKSEREACAKVAEEATSAWTEYEFNSGCMYCAKAIRARGEEKSYAAQAAMVESQTQGRMQIDPTTGDVSIGTIRARGET